MNQNDRKDKEKQLLNVIGKLLNLIICLMILAAILVYVNFCGIPKAFLPDDKTEDVIVEQTIEKKLTPLSDMWIAPDTSTIPPDFTGEQIRYGRMLIVNTAFYLGPNGKVKHISNGMNCQNCHLDAGTKFFGNNYSAVASTYPKFRERSESIESIYKRVNDCFERSLNGKALDTLSAEMQAIKAYMVWLGKDVNKGDTPKGFGLKDLPYLDRAANPFKGKIIYVAKCQSCHLENGTGKLNANGLGYQYPPLWGSHSYNMGAGLFRLSRFASYVKFNMPFGVSYDNVQLTDEEAWDIAAFVNSQERPSKKIKKDWPKISQKPIDNPFGPYADSFSENEHKYGPFKPIAEFKKNQKEK